MGTPIIDNVSDRHDEYMNVHEPYTLTYTWTDTATIQRDCYLNVEDEITTPRIDDPHDNIELMKEVEEELEEEAHYTEYSVLTEQEWKEMDEIFMEFNAGLAIPTPKHIKDGRLAPISILTAETIQNTISQRPFVVLFDS